MHKKQHEHKEKCNALHTTCNTQYATQAKQKMEKELQTNTNTMNNHNA